MFVIEKLIIIITTTIVTKKPKFNQRLQQVTTNNWCPDENCLFY